MLGLRGDSHPATPRPRPGNVHLPRGDRNVSARRCPLGRSDLAPAGAGSQGGSVGPGGGSTKEHPVSAVGLGDQGRCGWGRAGPLGGERAAEVSEDGAGHGPVLDGGDDAQPAATAGTGENIEIEHAVHQRRPGPGVRGDGGAGAGLEGERKQVTVLVADLKGSMELLADRDPEEARKLLDPVLERMMEAVHRYEGTVNQVMGDGIMALFGAPLAHEDHAVRACYAALRMQESVKRYAEGVRRREGVV